jgi:peptidoglycan/LPS O-acetylase OafA/YrhL
MATVLQSRAPMTAAADRRIPSLDGLRAISILLVLVSHLAGTRNFPISASAGNFWGLGEFGVVVFFVISGFLITGLLLDEVQRTNGISLGHFYFRRTLRIFPPYYAYLAIIGVASLAGVIQLGPHDIAHTMTYTSNYHPGRSWFVGHTWSLSVEEQFYLLWPAVLLLAGTRRGVIIAAAVVVICPLIRIGEWELLRAFGNGVGHRFETIADSIAIGCVLAGVRPYLHRTTWYPRLLASPVFIVVPVLAVAGNLLHDHPLISFAVGMTLTNVAIALCMDWAVTFHDGRVGRVLNAAPLVFVGWLSYSLYLWQQPFLNRASDAPLAAFPLNILIVMALAVGSYFIVERPSLVLRKRIERNWASSRRPSARVTPKAERALELDTVVMRRGNTVSPVK